MNEREKREQMITHVTNLLRGNAFSFEFKVRKHPQGIKIICEVTQEEMDELMKQQKR